MSSLAIPRRGPAPRRGGAIAAIVAALLAVVLIAAYLYDHSRSTLIAPGVRAAGVDVGGLHAADARHRLEQALPRRLTRPVTVTAAGHRYVVNVARAHPRLNVESLVNDAVARSRSGWFVSRAVRAVTGGHVNADVSGPVRYDGSALDRLTHRVAAKVDRSARDASVNPSTDGLHRVASRNGRQVDAGHLRAVLAAAVTHPGAPRRVHVPVAITHPKVLTSQLAAKYPRYIVVDRAHYRLRLYKHLKLAKTYAIAVGMQGLETPAGLYDVQWKEVNPPWLVPNSAWAGSLAGRTIPPGPQDPLKARFMAFNGGAGIHGIDPSEYGTIGHNASHGCVRMTIPDVVDLYRQVPVHTPVYVGG